MNKVNIIINSNSLYKYESDSIIGEIYFQIGDFVFPEVKWTDFVVVILTWWNKEFMYLKNASIQSSYELDFMDGPFMVKVTKKSLELVELEFLRETVNKKISLYRIECSLDEISKTLLRATNSLIKQIKINNWNTEDVQELEKWKK
ncbi:hypothetical protein COJ46_22125 [Bacillus sp. AFS077874]|uniref:hypothetical protein n=1 Tax=Bacillus sp. AFS077874 TaxID=2033513 RepID=UPI000BF359B4|nr:hypothetical protein [Bacillus sp. AFS077874]PFM75253.1 hypothetical protein COJ46_22125 [Bacillus sp. AFS077874]